MKSIIISTGNGSRDKSGDLRLQTRPSGDLEIVEVSRGSGEERPANQIKGVIERDRVPALAEFLLQHQLDHQI